MRREKEERGGREKTREREREKEREKGKNKEQTDPKHTRKEELEFRARSLVCIFVIFRTFLVMSTLWFVFCNYSLRVSS